MGGAELVLVEMRLHHFLKENGCGLCGLTLKTILRQISYAHLRAFNS